MQVPLLLLSLLTVAMRAEEGWLDANSTDIVENTYEQPETLVDNEDKDEQEDRKKEIENKIKNNLVLVADYIDTLQVTDIREDNYPNLISYGILTKQPVGNINYLRIWSILSDKSMTVEVAVKTLPGGCPLRLYHRHQTDVLQSYHD